MKIYIASSWKNQHGVEMLTSLLREKGHEVISWIENNYGEDHNHVTKKFSFQEWMGTEQSEQSFWFDVKGATECNLLIFYSYAGNDAHAEMGAAWANNIPIYGLYSKDAALGLMSKMVTRWFSRYPDLLEAVEKYEDASKTFEHLSGNPFACFGRRPHVMDFDSREEYQERLMNWKDWNKSQAKQIPTNVCESVE
jgi:hypothetical protein